MVPKQYAHFPTAHITMPSTQNEVKIPVYTAKPDDMFLSIVHVALKLRSDTLDNVLYKGVGITKEDAIAHVPESLHMFRAMLYGGRV